MPRIIILSDGKTWETFEADSVLLVDITDEGMEQLLEDADSIHEVYDSERLAEQSLADWHAHDDMHTGV